MGKFTIEKDIAQHIKRTVRAVLYGRKEAIAHWFYAV